LAVKTHLVVLLTSSCAEAWGVVVLMPVWEKVLTAIKKAEKL